MTYISRIVVSIFSQDQPHKDTGCLEEGELESAQKKEFKFSPMMATEQDVSDRSGARSLLLASLLFTQPSTTCHLALPSGHPF